ncbi:DUF3883 domain-containing protein [Geodermatophilus sp. SYSU D01180]
MAPPLVTEENLGAWLLRSNPRRSQLDSAVADGWTHVYDWDVAQNYRSRMMAAGQRVILWSTDGGKRMPRGIWGLGHVTGPARDGVVDVDIPLLTTPITHAELEAAGIGDLEVQVQKQGPNPSWVSKEQLARLETLLPAWPEPAAVGAAGAGSSAGAGFGDAEQNKRVEMAAMRAVRDAYEGDGWEVEDVSARNCGWDLTCTSRRQVAKVEVKGVRGARPAVILTANEVRAARNDQHWVLAVVLQALGAAEVVEFTAQQALAAAEPHAFTADLTAAL